MNVVILDQQFNREKRFQIMRRVNYGVYHIFPGQLFTLEQAREICAVYGFTIDAIGTLYQITK